MAQINVRVEDSIKQRAEQVFDEIGLSTNAAITVFLKTCVRENRIPFPLTAEPMHGEAKPDPKEN